MQPITEDSGFNDASDVLTFIFAPVGFLWTSSEVANTRVISKCSEEEVRYAKRRHITTVVIVVLTILLSVLFAIMLPGFAISGIIAIIISAIGAFALAFETYSDSPSKAYWLSTVHKFACMVWILGYVTLGKAAFEFMTITLPTLFS